MPEVKKTELTELQKEIATLTKPLVARVKVLNVDSPTSLSMADKFLGQVCDARKSITARIKKILDPLNEVRTQVLDLKREMDSPLEILEGELRESMRQYRLGEQRKEAEEAQKRLAEQRRLDAAAEQKRQQAERASAPAVKKRLEKQAEEMEEKVQELIVTPPTAPVNLMGSGTRTIRKIRITDGKALLAGIISGEVPDDIITFNMTLLERYRRTDEAIVKTWAGIECYDDIEIVRRKA